MNVIGDTDEAASGGEGASLDPGEAAKILEQAKRQARRQFDPQPPLAVVVGAAGVFLFGYGAVWWSMRDQHVYTTGPALWSLAVLYGLIAVSAIVGSVVFNRARSGVSGRARRQQQAQAAAFAAAGIGAWVVEGALRYRGVSFEIVYGVFGPTVPLIALVAVAAGINAMRESWLQLGVCIAIIAVTSVSTFFGPLGAWGLTGLGCCLVLLAYAAVLVVQQRRS
jgi:hypothetical protein